MSVVARSRALEAPDALVLQRLQSAASDDARHGVAEVDDCIEGRKTASRRACADLFQALAESACPNRLRLSKPLADINREALFISDTACMVGHTIVHLGDVRRQTEESLLNTAIARQAAADICRADLRVETQAHGFARTGETA